MSIQRRRRLRGKSGATLRALLRAVSLVVCLVTALVATASAFAATRPMRTAIVDPASFAGANQTDAFAKTAASGATFVRLTLNWDSVAPDTQPPDPSDPNDPGYDWANFDSQVEGAIAAGLEPIVCIEYAPSWAGGISPNATAFGEFARAAARRYSGEPGGEPRVRYWQAWNEPNRDYFLQPQYTNGKMSSRRALPCDGEQVRRGRARRQPDEPRDRGRPRAARTEGQAGAARLHEEAARGAGLVRHLGPPSVHVGRPAPHSAGQERHRARQPRQDERAAQGEGREDPPLRSRAVLGDRVLLGLEPARPARAGPAAAQALGGRGALPHVGGRRLARHLVPPQGRPADRNRRDAVPVGLLHGRRHGRSRRSTPSASRPSRSRSRPASSCGAARPTARARR